MAAPTIPTELRPPEGVSLDLEQIWYAVCEELTNPQFLRRKHYNRRTYDAGCEGPICKKAVRDYARRRVLAPQARYLYLDPVLDFFYKEARAKIEKQQRQMLNQLID